MLALGSTHLDRLLRGDVTRAEELREGRIDIDAGGMAVMIVLLGMIYGLCMGSYSLLKEVPDSVQDPNRCGTCSSLRRR